MENFVGITLDIITMMGIIIGLGCLKVLRDKTYGATFGFWTQFYNRVYELLKWLEDDKSIIDNLYSPQARKPWASNLAPSGSRTREFKERVEEMLKFLEESSDQMPAYIGWTTDYNFLIDFFYDVKQYDICDASDSFKFCTPVDISERDRYCEKIVKTMTHMCHGIKQRQNAIEKRIYKLNW